MPKHDYKNPDKADNVRMPINLRALADALVAQPYGVHQMLSHLVDARKQRHRARIDSFRRDGHDDAAKILEEAGDILANELEKLLDHGLF